MNKLPLARNNDILVQPSGNELLIYDLTTNKAYHLNQTSGIVYQACDGKTTFDDLKNKHKLTDEIIFLALDELKRENLLDQTTSYQSKFTGVSRREVIKRVGLSTMIVLPVISSLIAPSASHAQSGGFAPGSRTVNQSCTASVQCASSASVCTVASKCCVGPGTSPPGPGNAGEVVTSGSCSDPIPPSCPAAVASSCCSGAITTSCTQGTPAGPNSPRVILECNCN